MGYSGGYLYGGEADVGLVVSAKSAQGTSGG